MEWKDAKGKTLKGFFFLFLEREIKKMALSVSRVPFQCLKMLKRRFDKKTGHNQEVLVPDCRCQSYPIIGPYDGASDN